MRVGIYVNVSNQFSALSSKRKGHRVNYAKYLEFASSFGDTNIAVIAYGTQVGTEAGNFIQVLKRLGYSTKFSFSAKIGQNIIHPNRNIEITIDIMSILDKLDVIILGSNDRELIPLIQYVRSRGVTVVLATPIVLHDEATKSIDIIDHDIVQYIQSMRDE